MFQDKAAVDKLIDRFLARTQIEDGATASGPAANALTLLRGMTSSSGSSGLWNLLASKADRRYWIEKRSGGSARSVSSVAT